MSVCGGGGGASELWYWQNTERATSRPCEDDGKFALRILLVERNRYRPSANIGGAKEKKKKKDLHVNETELKHGLG